MIATITMLLAHIRKLNIVEHSNTTRHGIEWLLQLLLASGWSFLGMLSVAAVPL